MYQTNPRGDNLIHRFAVPLPHRGRHTGTGTPSGHFVATSPRVGGFLLRAADMDTSAMLVCHNGKGTCFGSGRSGAIRVPRFIRGMRPQAKPGGREVKQRTGPGEGSAEGARAERCPSGVRSARKTARWAVFSEERAAAQGRIRRRRKRGGGPVSKALCGAAVTAERYCELRPEAKRGGSVVGFGAPGKQSGGLFSAKNGRQPRGVVRSGSDSKTLLRTEGAKPRA